MPLKTSLLDKRLFRQRCARQQGGQAKTYFLSSWTMKHVAGCCFSTAKRPSTLPTAWGPTAKLALTASATALVRGPGAKGLCTSAAKNPGRPDRNCTAVLTAHLRGMDRVLGKLLATVHRNQQQQGAQQNDLQGTAAYRRIMIMPLRLMNLDGTLSRWLHRTGPGLNGTSCAIPANQQSSRCSVPDAHHNAEEPRKYTSQSSRVMATNILFVQVDCLSRSRS